jgi:Ca2+-binding RTX toxin-like protein
MVVETLENRRMLSVSLNGATKVLTIQGDDKPALQGNDTILVDVVGANYRVTDNGVVSFFQKVKVSKIVAFGNAGQGDVIKISPAVTIPTELHSGGEFEPDGELQGGSGPDIIFLDGVRGDAFGGKGNDIFVVHGDNNTVQGGDGDDTIIVSEDWSGDSGWAGGNGNDTLDYSEVNTPLVLRNGSIGVWDGNNQGIPSNDLDSANGFEIFYGGQQGDLITGNHRDNKIYGGPGNDTLLGGDANDSLFGGPGMDRLFGQAGNDQLYGDGNSDILEGGTGIDAHFGGNGNDVFNLEDGNQDYAEGGFGTDFSTNDANDILNSIEFPGMG